MTNLEYTLKIIVFFEIRQGQNSIPDKIPPPAGFGREQDRIFFFQRQGSDNGSLLTTGSNLFTLVLLQPAA